MVPLTSDLNFSPTSIAEGSPPRIAGVTGVVQMLVVVGAPAATRLNVIACDTELSVAVTVALAFDETDAAVAVNVALAEPELIVTDEGTAKFALLLPNPTLVEAV